MEFIREFASQKYHIAREGSARMPICRKRRFKYLQLSIVPTPLRDGLCKVPRQACCATEGGGTASE